MTKHLFETPQYEESLRRYLHSPVPGEIHFSSYEEAVQTGYLLDESGLEDLRKVTETIAAHDEASKQMLPPASFRADTVMIVASMLGSQLGHNSLSEEEILEADRLIFRGGKTQWLGLEVETRPLFSELLDNNTADVVSSVAVAKYIADTVEGAKGPSWLGIEPPDRLMGEGELHEQKASLGGKLLQRLLREGASQKVRDEDLTLLMEHYEETGQILLGTNDQFVQAGDSSLGSKAFWLLQLHEANQAPISQATNNAGNTVVKYYEDGSRRTEIYTGHNNKAKIIFEAPNNVVDFGDKRAEEPVLSLVAGYEQYRQIPYLPHWMRETEIADVPVTVLLDVYPDRYVMSVVN
jgi:hypothetical protein